MFIITKNQNKMRQTKTNSLVLALAASVFIFQGLPAIFMASDVISEHTSKVVNLICDVCNLFCAAAAIYLNKPLPTKS